MGDILRRRAMMQMASAPVAEKLFVGASYGGGHTRGSVTQYGDGAFRIVSTGAANWSLYQNPYGDASLFKTFDDIKGHTILFTIEITNLTLVTGASFVFAYTLTGNITRSTFSRTRYSEISDLNLGANEFRVVIPTALDGWESGSGGSDSNRFSYRFYLNSASGSDITVNKFEAFDLGII